MVYLSKRPVKAYNWDESGRFFRILDSALRRNDLMALGKYFRKEA